jgi:hypothetical protein
VIPFIRFRQLLQRSLVLASALVVASVTHAQVALSPTATQSSDHGETIFSLIDNQYIHVDLKAISADKGSFGIDYKVQFDKTLIQEENDMGRKWQLNLSSAGFLTAEPDKNDVDSIITEIAFKATPLWRVVPKERGTIPPELLEDPVALKKWMEDHADDFISPLSLYAKASGKYETTQTGDVFDFAMGGALGLTTGYLNFILDAPFAALRIPSKEHPASSNGPRQIDVSVGYDFVTGRHVDNAAKTSDSEGDVNRLVVKAEWETGILRGDRIIFSFNGNEQFAGPQEGFHPFFLARYEHLLFNEANAKIAFAVNYTAGELPPAFKADQVIGGGFSIDWK